MNSGAIWAVATQAISLEDGTSIDFSVNPLDASMVHMGVASPDGSHTDYQFMHNGLMTGLTKTPPASAAAAAAHETAAHKSKK